MRLSSYEILVVDQRDIALCQEERKYDDQVYISVQEGKLRCCRGHKRIHQRLFTGTEYTVKINVYRDPVTKQFPAKHIRGTVIQYDSISLEA